MPDFGTTSLRLALAVLALCLASCAGVRPATQQVPVLGATTWTSFDGKAMPWREWRVPPDRREKAVIITVHGLSGAASDFWLLGERLPPQGCSVYGYELRGQGNDPDIARRGDIDSADQWLKDLLTFHKLVRARHPGVPIVWYGESLGSLIAMHAAVTSQARPDAIVMATPIAGLRMDFSHFERLALRGTSYLLPGYRFTLGGLAGIDEKKMRVTSTTTHGNQMARTQHHVGEFTLRLLRELDGLMNGNKAVANHITMPVLMLGSPHDLVSSPDQVQTLFAQLGGHDKVLHWYSRSYHLLLHDVQHDQVVADLLKWLNRMERLKPRVPAGHG